MPGIRANFPQVNATTNVTAQTVLQSNSADMMDYRAYAELLAQVVVSGMATSVGAGLSIWIQSSMDGGTTWQDFANVNTTAVTTKFIQVSSKTAGGNAPLAAADGNLAVNTVVQGPFGSQFRVKYTTVNTTTGTTTFQIILYAKD